MRTEETKIYKFEELSEEAKERALKAWVDSIHEFFWMDEYFDSIKEGIRAFDCTLDDYNIDWLDTSRSSFKVNSWGLEEFMTRDRDLGTILNEDYKNKIYSEGGCPFTGFCGDEDFLDPIRAFLKNPDKETTMEELMDDCVYSVLLAASKEAEHQTTEEYFTDHADADGFEFTEDGKMW